MKRLDEIACTLNWIEFRLNWVEFKYVDWNLIWFDLDSNSTKFNLKIRLKLSSIGLKSNSKNGMQIGGKGMENLLTSMVKLGKKT
jgi:hypothetical protein